MIKPRTLLILAAISSLTAFLAFNNAYTADPHGADSRQWLAGDHHIHSRYSVGWDRETDPPTPILAGDAIYPIAMNAVMGRRYGLDWIVSTDHGGPNHSRINRDFAYQELLESRKAVPDVVQFYGMEFDTPGADHSSLIIPFTNDEADTLFRIESQFAKREPWPADPSWDTEDRMIDALQVMKEFPEPPIVIAHHPSRSATDLGVYGQTEPAELRAWNDTAPHIAIGMEGSPGHQAAALRQRPLTTAEENDNSNARRGGYGRFPAMGGYDQMTAQLGGFWDSMLAEGRHWWITANSDSHRHWREGGVDFWPGEYSKTYIHAEKNHTSIMESFRQGRIFVTTGDLVSELWVTASSAGNSTDIGGSLKVTQASDVTVSIRFLVPDRPNFNGDSPVVNRVDLIVGDITGPVDDPDTNSTPGTRVEARFSASDWRTDGSYRAMNYTMRNVDGPVYLRVRGTNTNELEPELDPPGENPWQDLWFYSNPIFIELQ
jgi:hypothetical protein